MLCFTKSNHNISKKRVSPTTHALEKKGFVKLKEYDFTMTTHNVPGKGATPRTETISV